ncbi:MAG: hypothetical protein C4K58_01200 [Flavobacteriaceae bacterium]|nr:MAG: hypothetical protein C4K58_01200 [Flavobacteriaceae bacterium]
MKKRKALKTLGIFLLSLQLVFSQEIDPSKIDIVRDAYGVPDIFAKTNREAAYGVAWAQCEDNFKTLQDLMITVSGIHSKYDNKGIIFDLTYQMYDFEGLIQSQYSKDITPELESILEAYCLAINQYAKTHPEKVVYKELFPLSPKQILKVYSMALFAPTAFPSIAKVFKNKTLDTRKILVDATQKGSNAFALSSPKTADGKTYLIGNPHQPIGGPYEFWEVGVHTEEGLDIHGVTFSGGGVFPTIGTTPNLGWTHTVNYLNNVDTYKLEMHPTKKNTYKYDEKWIELEEKTARITLHLGGMKIPLKKKYYLSQYGPTLKNKTGYYSVKSSVLSNLRHFEQWYEMAKSTNLEQFTKALEIQGIGFFTVTYADKEDNIFLLNNALIPIRDESFDYTEVLVGNTSKNNWNAKQVHPIQALPWTKNPVSGYVYNTNNSPLSASSTGDNPKYEDFPKSFRIHKPDNSRSRVLYSLLENSPKISFEKAKEIRDNVYVDKNHLSEWNCMNCDVIPKLLAETPELAPAKAVYDKWNGEFSIDNKQAPLAAFAAMKITDYVYAEYANPDRDIPEEVLVQILLDSQKFLLKHYGTLEFPLGDLQKVSRFGEERPMYGCPFTLANSKFELQKDHTLKLIYGDTYIFYAKYGKQGLEELRTINTVGNSLEEGNPRSTNQMDLYVNKQTKNIELDKEKIRVNGTLSHPQ